MPETISKKADAVSELEVIPLFFKESRRRVIDHIPERFSGREDAIKLLSFLAAQPGDKIEYWDIARGMWEKREELQLSNYFHSFYLMTNVEGGPVRHSATLVTDIGILDAWGILEYGPDGMKINKGKIAELFIPRNSEYFTYAYILDADKEKDKKNKS